MVEIGSAAETKNDPITKQLNDRSYKAGEGDESGLESMASGTASVSIETSNGDSQGSSGYGSSDAEGKSSWEDYEGEVVNLSTFKLEALQSSNVIERRHECDISTIEHTNDAPLLRKGNDLETHTDQHEFS